MNIEGKYSSVLVSKYITAYANERGIEMNITKLQKLLFITYGVYLVATGERLTDERVRAWPFGPVFPKVSKAYRREDEYEGITLKDIDAKIQEDEELNKCLAVVFRTFGNDSASQLVNWTHNDDSPWTLATKKEGFNWNDKISDEDIKNYFYKICVWKKKK